MGFLITLEQSHVSQNTLPNVTHVPPNALQYYTFIEHSINFPMSIFIFCVLFMYNTYLQCAPQLTCILMCCGVGAIAFHLLKNLLLCSFVNSGIMVCLSHMAPSF